MGYLKPRLCPYKNPTRTILEFTQGFTTSPCPGAAYETKESSASQPWDTFSYKVRWQSGNRGESCAYFSYSRKTLSGLIVVPAVVNSRPLLWTHFSVSGSVLRVCLHSCSVVFAHGWRWAHFSSPVKKPARKVLDFLNCYQLFFFIQYIFWDGGGLTLLPRMVLNSWPQAILLPQRSKVQRL